MSILDGLDLAFDSMVDSALGLADVIGGGVSVVAGALGLFDRGGDGGDIAGQAAQAALVGGGFAPEFGKQWFAGGGSGGGGGGILGGVGQWMQKNPVPTMVLGQAAANAFTPDAIDVQNNRLKNQMELEEWRRRYAAKNTNVAGVNLGMRPSGRPLTDSQGRRVGIMGA